MNKKEQFVNIPHKAKAFCIFVVCFVYSGLAVAADSVPFKFDIYGTHKLVSSILAKKYSSELQSIATVSASAEGLSTQANQRILLANAEKIVSEVKKMDKFAFVNLSPVLYPQDKTIYITLDVVDKGDEKRLLQFSPKPKQSIPDPNQLIKKWMAYQAIGFSIMSQEKPLHFFKTCPVYHCLFGFEYPKLKKYKKIFMTQVPKNQIRLIDVLKHDKDSSKRAAAAYLLAHIKNGKKLIEALIPSVQDPDEQVRNSVMRVLAMTLSQVDYDQYPIEQAVRALNFPTTTDRNKALFMVSNLINKPIYARYVAKNAGSVLVNELRLYQPNNHDFAYEILKKISGKNYGERDYKAWDQWAKAQG